MRYFTNKFQGWSQSLPRTEEGELQWGLYLRRLAFRLLLWFLGISIGTTILFAFLPVLFTPLMVTRFFQQSNDPAREVRLKKDWVAFGELSPKLQLAVVCSEDQAFLEHIGFDLNAIERAYTYNKTHKQKRGASTISQQTAKNVFLWPSRTWLRKGLEVYFTFLIEVFWSKERIMTVYLNVIEFGDGIYGAEAAAQHFFKKKAKDLSTYEAALMAAVLPNPLKRNIARPSSLVRQRQRWIVGQMRMWGGKIDFDEPNTPRKAQ